MTAMQGGARFEVIARQWHDLAERRLAHYSELYRSGRWVRYYSKEHFALRMLEVIKAAKIWRDLASRSWSVQSWTDRSWSDKSWGEQPLARDDD
ncbi:MAG: hypothetical protein ACXW2U_14200, partial [Telluria sp.]